MTNCGFDNKKIVITRPIERSEALSKLIIQYNGNPIIVPTLELQLVKSPELLDMINNTASFDWIIFTSPAGVKSFFNLYTLNTLPCKVAVIGNKTEEELMSYNIKADLVPDKFTAEGLLNSFENIDIVNKKIALPRTLSARKVLPDGLERMGANVIVAEAYTSGIPKNKKGILNLIDMILNKEIDIITFTSPLTIKNLIQVLTEDRIQDLEKVLSILRSEIIIGSIGPITSTALLDYGIETVEPERYTVKDMIAKLLQNL